MRRALEPDVEAPNAPMSKWRDDLPAELRAYILAQAKEMAQDESVNEVDRAQWALGIASMARASRADWREREPLPEAARVRRRLQAFRAAIRSGDVAFIREVYTTAFQKNGFISGYAFFVALGMEGVSYDDITRGWAMPLLRKEDARLVLNQKRRYLMGLISCAHPVAMIRTVLDADNVYLDAETWISCCGLAAAAGHIPALEALLAYALFPNGPVAAAAGANDDALVLALSDGDKYNMYKGAVVNGHLAMVEWLLREWPPASFVLKELDLAALQVAAVKSGIVALANALFQVLPPDPSLAGQMESTVLQNGLVPMLEWLVARGTLPMPSVAAIQRVLEMPTTPVALFDWAVGTQRMPIDAGRIFQHVLPYRSMNVPIVKWLFEHGYGAACPADAAFHALNIDNKALLAYLVGVQRQRIDPRSVIEVLRRYCCRDHTNRGAPTDIPAALEWLGMSGAIRGLDAGLCAMAVTYANIKGLRALRRYGVQWGLSPLMVAVLPVLYEGRANGMTLIEELLTLGYPIQSGEWCALAEAAQFAILALLWRKGARPDAEAQLSLLRFVALFPHLCSEDVKMWIKNRCR